METSLEYDDLEKYLRFLKEANLNDSDSPLEVTALENGFVPEGDGLVAVDLERRI